MNIKHVDEVETTPVAAGVRTTVQVLIGPDEAPNFLMRRFVMGPGGGIPAHTNSVEHEQYVLRGRARLGIGRETGKVGPGDVVLIPAGVPHWYQVEGDEPFEFLCVVPNRADRIELVEGRE